MIKVQNKIGVYEIDGKEVASVPRPQLIVRSHWNRNEMVEIEIDGVRRTVLARDLHAAITNATNTAAH